MTTTRAAFAARTARRLQWVACIDGYDKLLTDGSTALALAAHTGTDWTEALDGLVVECRIQQTADPNNPFANKGGRCILHIKPDADDTFGLDVFRRGSGAWTTLSGTIDRNDTALSIRSNSGFDSGTQDAHIGVECIEYNATTSSNMTVTTRGKYSAVGCHSTGSGGSRFADHHRVALDANQVQSNPIVSEQPRRWIGRRVNVYLHVEEDDGTLNSKTDAELVFAGRIDSIGDEQNGYTVIQVRHLLADLADSVIGGNQFAATVPEGIYIPEGAVFKLTEKDRASGENAANDLVVVASGATGSNQIDAGVYSLPEITDFLNKWLIGEQAATRTAGFYVWKSPVETADGLRTICTWRLSMTTLGVEVTWTMPSGVAGMLGFAPTEGILVGGTTTFTWSGYHTVSYPARSVSPNVPYRTAVFAKGGPGGSLTSFQVFLENERGEFVNQYETLPTIIKPGLDSTKEWGLFLVDERVLIQASYENNQLNYCFITPFGQTDSGDSKDPFYTLGRRADDYSGDVTVRQVFDMEGSFEQIMNILHYNTGTDGYNHGTYDTQAAGLGAAVPGGYLGDPFEQSIANLPRAEAVTRLRVDEPTRLSELIGADLLARGAFPVWKNGHIVYQQWQSPTAAAATFTLNEENKYRPENSSEDPRSPTLETAALARPWIKFDYKPDFAFGRDIRYRASMSLIDHVGIDDGANGVTKPMTIRLRNVPGHEDAKSLIVSTLAKLPMRSRPSKFLTRSIGSDLFFSVAPGDVAIITDRFARDPLTGLRYNPSTDTGGLDERPAVLMMVEFDLGGEVPGQGHLEPRMMHGNVEINFFDQNRAVPYGPAADVDETNSAGGFSAGYNSSTKELACKDHVYSEATEDADATYFTNGASVIVVEKDPTDPSNPLYWEDTVASRSGSTLTLTTGLSGWDNTKTYRIIYNVFSTATALQKDYSFQAASGDEMIEDVDVPYLFAGSQSETEWTYNADEDTQFPPDLSYGDGASQDAGHERDLCNAINNLVDHKTAHHASFMWTEVPSGGASWRARYFGRIYLGQDQLSNGAYRYLTIAPWLWLDTTNAATTGSVRVTISRDMPKDAPGEEPSVVFAATYESFYSQATWTTTSTTRATGTPQTLEIRVKDLTWGMAYILVETENAYCTGLIEGREGARILAL